MEIEAIELPCVWADSMNKADYEKVIALYHESATLLPTYSSLLINHASGLINYFERLKKTPGLKVYLDKDTMTCNQIGVQSYVVCGFYTFAFEEESKAKQHTARYTFVVDLSLPRPIVHHHSSMLPMG